MESTQLHSEYSDLNLKTRFHLRVLLNFLSLLRPIPFIYTYGITTCRADPRHLCLHDPSCVYFVIVLNHRDQWHQKELEISLSADMTMTCNEIIRLKSLLYIIHGRKKKVKVSHNDML
jgi:hypothetical protein